MGLKWSFAILFFLFSFFFFFFFFFFGYCKNFKETSPCLNSNSPLTKSRKYQLRQVAQLVTEQLQSDIKNKRGNGQLDKGRCNLLLFGTLILFIGIAMFLPICLLPGFLVVLYLGPLTISFTSSWVILGDADCLD